MFPLERDVVVRGCGREVGTLRRCTGRHELVAFAAARAVPAAAEELDGVGDDLDRLALRPVLRIPLAPVEASVDADWASLREVLRAALGLVTPDRDVEVVGLVAPLAGARILLARVDGDHAEAVHQAAFFVWSSTSSMRSPSHSNPFTATASGNPGRRRRAPCPAFGKAREE